MLTIVSIKNKVIHNKTDAHKHFIVISGIYNRMLSILNMQNKVIDNKTDT